MIQELTAVAISNNKKGQRMPAQFVASDRFNLLVGLGLGSRGFRAINQLDERHRCIVADAETHFQNASVATRPRFVARAELIEQLGDDVTQESATPARGL